jgi:SAM-dependent methyltransferase
VGEPDVPRQVEAQWHAADVVRATGWDFSALRGRRVEERPPWDFEAMCRQALPTAGSVLDMGTGGGERLLRLIDRLPADTVATEGWEPNVPVATAALRAHGIAVIRYDSAATPWRPMPFPDDRFGLIMNRHESFDAAEIARTLRPGGVFLTQQVGADEFVEGRALFGPGEEFPDQRLSYWSGALGAAGLDIEDGQEWHGATRFTDVAALVHYLRLAPWQVPPDFGVDRYRDVLVRLHTDLVTHGRPITFTSSRFRLRAAKPRGKRSDET